MSLPVSSYEELLNRVRSLTNETRQLQRQIDAPLLDHNENERLMNCSGSLASDKSARARTDSSISQAKSCTPLLTKDVIGARWNKEQESTPEVKEQESPAQVNERGMKLLTNQSGMCHSTATVNTKQALSEEGLSYSFSYSSEQLGTKVEMVYNLLSMLGTHDRAEMTSTLLAMSSSPDSCKAMRQSGCLSLLVQLIHSSGESITVRQRAAQALRNMVLCHGDDKRGRREARVLRLLDQVTAYSDAITSTSFNGDGHSEDSHPGPAIAALMKLSFDEEHRLAMCQLGALYVIARLVQVEAPYSNECCITLKRYAGMALTNLTFGDGNNKALLCSMKPFMTALVAQLASTSEDLTQVTASVLRNLSWRADATSKQSLREVGSVSALVKAAMSASREQTLKSVLSALWNLSAHCNINKVDICGVEGALQYLVEMLNYQSTSKTLAVVENSGGILRNISSHVAVREDYRKVLREHNCLAILLTQLQSASLTVVSNACGTLWNLSARCPTDQRALVALGAVQMLTSLAHSRHRMIAMGASAALKNLLPVRLAQQQAQTPTGTASLLVRKRRALEAEFNSTLSETCDNIEFPAWDSERETSQVKEECDQINQSMQNMTLDETTEQPVNYSLKYCEKENKGNEVDNDAVNYSIKYKEENAEQKSYYNEEGVSEGDYAETDLDQVTDFSLRYNEEVQGDPTDTNTSLKCKELDKQSEMNSVEASPGKLEAGKGVTETPLMFSRCSSLGSLSSCEQQDDCQSSVVSEFSRITSGLMSPSELPDSPTQTIPPSPSIKKASDSVKKSNPGVFDDTLKAFIEESTPAQFSTATSLSDLTFEDDNHETGFERKELELAAVSEEEDDNVLADCINIGMQNSRDRVESLAAPTNCLHRSKRPRPNQASHVIEETPVQFFTEDTPASLSHATSHSELSCALSDASSDHDNILAECIQSGMPRSQNHEKIKSPSTRLQTPKVSPMSITNSRMKQLVAEDELSVFATEGSPGNFSIRSSLSDLTINSRPEKLLETHEVASPLSSLEPEVEETEATVLSGGSEEVTLADQDDQALLMQVISSGMPGSDKLKESTDTWAEETPNDMTYPSVSRTAPVIFSYDSDDDKEKTEIDETLTDMRVIKLNAGKVALISHMDMESSFVGIEDIQPPSNMASILSLSTSMRKDFDTSEFDSLNLENLQPPSALDSVLSCTSEEKMMLMSNTKEPSLLENVKPPLDIDDMFDLDNSILSVESLASDIVDSVEVVEEVPKKVTAKQRREMGKTRYNTYVINKDEEEVERPKGRITPKQRRQADRERFRTRTIHDVPQVESITSEESLSSHEPESTSEAEEPPRPIVVKPPEVKSIRGGAGKGSAIPVNVRSPIKTPPSGASGIKKKSALPQPLQRQGTFTKEEPSSCIPVPIKKIASPLKKTPVSANSSIGRGRATSLPTKSGCAVRTSLSNQSLKSACSDRNGSGSQSAAGRWHSNSSLNSQTPPAASKKDATSKIANLWKKVDDSKKKQTGQDTRVWIPSEPKNKQVA